MVFKCFVSPSSLGFNWDIELGLTGLGLGLGDRGLKSLGLGLALDNNDLYWNFERMSNSNQYTDTSTGSNIPEFD